MDTVLKKNPIAATQTSHAQQEEANYIGFHKTDFPGGAKICRLFTQSRTPILLNFYQIHR